MSTPSPSRWSRLEELFHGALSRPEAERGAYLDQECAGQPELRRELEAMLAAPLTQDGLAAAIRSEARRMVDQLSPGDLVGPYVVESLIGRGGMGAVYRARRAAGGFDQTVAIKLVQSTIRTGELLERFRRERQILARLNHPHIARLFDGGTWEGLPYLVMEFVDGRPLDEYCREQSLTVAERVRLLVSISDAVSYAHGQLVVHRDIKPQNILVTAAGVPKLLDFGIAKPLEEDAELTRASERLLTPRYAAPEQILGQPVTAATDVYALGALAYQVLTGRAPFDRPGLTGFTLEKAICEEDPVPMATLTTVDADLVAIVAKAMRKEPAARYPSAAALSADWNAFLKGYPVAARKGSWQYRTGKLIRRRAGAIAAGALITLSLVGGLVSTRIQQGRAERRFEDVRVLANRFLFEFHDTIAPLPGATRARQMVVQRAVEYLDRLAAESANDPRLLRDLAEGYGRVRDIQFSPRYGHLNDLQGALRTGEKVLALWRPIVDRSNADAAAIEAYINSLQQQANALLFANSSSQAADCLAQAETWINRIRTLRPTAADPLQVRNSLLRAEVSRSEGVAESAVTESRRALALAESFAPAAGAPGQRTLAEALLGLGISLAVTANQPLEAIAPLRRAEQLFQETARARPNDIDAQRNSALSTGVIGLAYAIARKHDEALPYRRAALAQALAIQAQDPENSLAQHDLVEAYINAAQNEYKVGSKETAIAHGRAVVALTESLLDQGGDSVQARDDYTTAMEDLADHMVRTTPKAEPYALLMKALRLREEDAARYPERNLLKSRLGHLYIQLGDSCLFNWNELENAEKYYRQALAIYERLAASKALNGLDQRDWDIAKDHLQRVLDKKPKP